MQPVIFLCKCIQRFGGIARASTLGARYQRCKHCLELKNLIDRLNGENCVSGKREGPNEQLATGVWRES